MRSFRAALVATLLASAASGLAQPMLDPWRYVPDGLTDPRVQAQIGEGIDRQLGYAQREQLAGECRRSGQRLAGLSRWIERLGEESVRRGGGFTPAQLDAWRTRVSEAQARPCPPAGAAPPAPPPAQVVSPPVPQTPAPPPRQQGLPDIIPGLIPEGEIPSVETLYQPAEARLAEAATYFAAGNCAAWLDALAAAERAVDSAQQEIPDLEAATRERGNLDFYRDYGEGLRARIAEQRSRFCGSPPPADATFADLPVAGPLGPSLPVTVTGSVALGQADVPVTGIGFVRDGPSGSAPERFAGTSPGRVDTTGANLRVDVLTSALEFTVEGAYATGDGETSFVVPAGGPGASGIVYGALSQGGSSGIAAPFGLTGAISTDLEQLRLGFKVGPRSDDPQPKARYYFYFDYFRVEERYRGNAAGAGTSGGFAFQFEQQRDQEIDENFFTIGVGGALRIPLAPALSLVGEGQGGVSYRTTDLRSTETDRNNFSALPDRDFTNEIRDDDDGLAFSGDATLGLELRIASNIFLRADGTVSYRSRAGAIFNPSSGDQVFFDDLETGLRTQRSLWRYGGRLGIRIGLR